MNRRTLGIVATVVGSAFGAWWLTAYRRAHADHGQQRRQRNRGEVIFDNTPLPADSADGII